MGHIYIITKKDDGRMYIGQTTTSFRKRWNSHISGSKSSLIDRYLKKYGKDAFEVECLEVSNNLLNLWEKHLIQRYNTIHPNGFNLTNGGEGSSPCEEVRQKISISNQHPKSPEHRQKIIDRITSNEYRKYTSKCLTGIKRSEKTKEKIKRTRQHGATNKLSKTWIVISPIGNVIEVKGIRQFCRNNNLDYACMCVVRRGERNQYKGYKVLDVSQV
jgi:group I intron endonuclease